MVPAESQQSRSLTQVSKVKILENTHTQGHEEEEVCNRKEEAGAVGGREVGGVKCSENIK
jgi:hypothetical protein